MQSALPTPKAQCLCHSVWVWSARISLLQSGVGEAHSSEEALEIGWSQGALLWTSRVREGVCRLGNRPATEQLTIWGSVDVWQSAHIKRVREIRRYFTLEPNRWFLATYRNQPAGVVGATNYGPFTYLGMMTVRKEL